MPSLVYFVGCGVVPSLSLIVRIATATAATATITAITTAATAITATTAAITADLLLYSLDDHLCRHHWQAR